ncbi:hypothetical protein V8D89_008276 [Ganoderma adspersum]
MRRGSSSWFVPIATTKFSCRATGTPKTSSSTTSRSGVPLTRNPRWPKSSGRPLSRSLGPCMILNIVVWLRTGIWRGSELVWGLPRHCIDCTLDIRVQHIVFFLPAVSPALNLSYGSENSPISFLIFSSVITPNLL